MQGPEEQTESRAERTRARHARRNKIAALVALVCVAAAAIAGLGWFVTSRASSNRSAATLASLAGSPSARVAAASALATSTAVTSRVEVPDLSGMAVEQARTVLKAAGLATKVSVEGTASSAAEVVVRAQRPVPGTVTSSGSTVALMVPAFAGKPSGKQKAKRSSGPFIVVIDPGHQSHADSGLEPVGPGSTEMKPRVTAGATGVTSGVPEYEVDLEIATNLQDRLEAAGVRVVMTRTTNDVDVSNAERAQIANSVKADLFVRIHADGSTDPKAAGVSTLYPATNQWTKPIVGSSRTAAAAIQRFMLASTGAQDGGYTARSDIAGFNWAKVPSVLVQTGFQSNSVEDRLLSSPRYQDLLAKGMADGILAYLKGER